MRSRFLGSTAVGALVALVTATAAVAGSDDGGFSPVDPRSPNANRVDDAYWIIFGFTSFIFVGVVGTLLVFVWRYRSRSRDRLAEGAQVHGNTRLEVAWTAFPVIVLVAIGAVIFYYLPGIKNTPSARADPNRIDVDVVGHRFYWLFRYPNGAVSIDRLRAPVNTTVSLRVTAPDDDVIHSWWIPALNGKVDAIPGRENHQWFRTKDVGLYRGQCAEFCGVQHAAMFAWVEVMPRARYDAWLAARTKAQQSAAADFGAEEWTGACAKCHGAGGEGLVGPRIAGNPLFQDRAGFETLIREGRVRMPPVAQDWTKEQVDALFAYVQKNLSQGGDQVSSEQQPAQEPSSGG